MKLTPELKLAFGKIEKKWKFYFGAMAAILASSLTAFIPYIYGRATDIAISPQGNLKIVFFLIALWLVLSVASDLLNRFSSRQGGEVATYLTCTLITDIFFHIVNLPLSFHKTKKIGEITRKVFKGVDEFTNMLERTIFSFIPQILTFFIALIILLSVEWRLALILVGTAVLYALVTFLYTKEIIVGQDKMHENWEKAYGTIWEAFFAAHAVKSSTSEEFEKEKNRKNFFEAGDFYNHWRLIWLRMDLWQRLIFACGFIAVFSTGIFMLRSGALTPGVFIMFIGYTSLLTSPLSQLANQYRQTKSAITAFARAAEFLTLPQENDRPDAKELEIKGKIVFNDVCFWYKKEKEILKNVSFSIEPGQTIALVGESGVGKTTLSDLVGRYFRPCGGKISIDGIDAADIRLKCLREQMAIVPQEIILFNDTIRNNIQYGNPFALETEIIEAAKAANAHDFIQNLPKKYDQLVGDRGVKLSTGQKQRIAVARAILRNPKILILDEATSALDSVSERLVQEALQKLIKNRTTIVIAHRLSTIMNADKIIVLEKGGVAETGRHQDLMQNPAGIYRNFWEMQTAIQKIKE